MKKIAALLAVTVIIAAIAGSVYYLTDRDKTEIVHITEYGDFECPACAAFYPVLKEAMEIDVDNGIDIDLEFKHFPIAAIHPRAMTAHRASEAAAIQGKFWEMHDILYENQAEWNSINGPTNEEADKVIEGYAKSIGLDIDLFRSDVASQAVEDKISVDIQTAQELNVDSVPSLFVVNNFGEENESRVKIRIAFGISAGELISELKLAAEIEE